MKPRPCPRCRARVLELPTRDGLIARFDTQPSPLGDIAVRCLSTPPEATPDPETPRPRVLEAVVIAPGADVPPSLIAAPRYLSHRCPPPRGARSDWRDCATPGCAGRVHLPFTHCNRCWDLVTPSTRGDLLTLRAEIRRGDTRLCPRHDRLVRLASAEVLAELATRGVPQRSLLSGATA